MVFLGIDWAEKHHDACLLAEDGRSLGAIRIADSIEGLRDLGALVAEHADSPEEVVVGIETDRGLLVQGLIAAGYQVYAINPLAVSRYRDRHNLSGAKSDAADAKLLADVVRTDRHNHRPVAGDSELAEAVKVLARAHQNLVWTRQRHLNQMRSALREYFPGLLEVVGPDRGWPDALAVLEVAATPAEARRLSVTRIRNALRRGGRARNLDSRAEAIHEALSRPGLEQQAVLAEAYGSTVRALAAVVRQLDVEIARLEARVTARFEQHPDAEILGSLPGLGTVLGARVLAEFGDDPNRYDHARSRRCYAGTAPITKASGTRKVVMARFVRNPRLVNACHLWAFSAIRWSPGARTYYDALRKRGKSHHQALRALANRLVGIMHGCLASRRAYDEATAWAHQLQAAA